MVNLAKKIVMDGEGAKKFIEITVKNAKNVARAKRSAFQLQIRSLVKTAIAGEDPNWGRLGNGYWQVQDKLRYKIKNFYARLSICEKMVKELR